MENFQAQINSTPQQTQPMQPVQPAQYNKPKGNRLKIFLPIAILLVFAIAFTGSAYYFSFWPFSVGKPEELFSKSFYNLFKIDSASYGVKINLKGQPKSADAVKLSAELSDYTDTQQPMYDRDNDRIRDIGIIKSKLFVDSRVYASSVKRRFPTNLGTVGVTNIKDPSGNVYEYKAINNNEDFNLTIQFETTEGVESVSRYSTKGSLKVDGKKVTFNKDSLIYFYGNQIEPKMPVFLSYISSINSAILFLPSDTNFNLNVNGLIQNQADKIPDTKFGFGADVAFSGMSYKAGAEIIKKEEDIYFKLNDFPALFFGSQLDTLKNKWVQVKPDDLGDRYIGYGANDMFKAGNEVKKQILEQLKLSFDLAVSQGAIVGTDKAERQIIDGKTYYKYVISLKKDKIVALYKKLSDEFNSKFGDKALIKFDKTTYEYLQSPAFDKLFNYIDKNIKFNYYVDPRTSYPYMFEYKIRLVPDETAKSSYGFYGSRPVSNNEFMLTVGVSLENVNKPIKVEAPKDFTSFMDAEIAMTGKTKEQYLSEKQISNIPIIMAALNNYYILVGSYPNSLDDLKKNLKEITIVKKPILRNQDEKNRYQSIEYYKSKFEKSPFLENAPNDVYTGKPYQYKHVVSSSLEDFDLSFEVKIPAYQKGKIPGYSVYKNYGAYDSKTRKYINAFDLIYNNGVNHINFSTDPNKKSIIDSDKDGISDSLENYMGLDPKKMDTDGDGVTDGEELSLRSNPAGQGSLSY